MGKIHIIRKEGGSRVISITKILPIDWQAIEMDIVKQTKTYVTIKVLKVK